MFLTRISPERKIYEHLCDVDTISPKKTIIVTNKIIMHTNWITSLFQYLVKEKET
jgi:hypothetical protein